MAAVTPVQVHTYADGFGRWYAAVPWGSQSAHVAAEAIRVELAERGDIDTGYRVVVERAPVWSGEAWPAHVVYREHFDPTPEVS